MRKSAFVSLGADEERAAVAGLDRLFREHAPDDVDPDLVLALVIVDEAEGHELVERNFVVLISFEEEGARITTDPEGTVGDGIIYDTVTERACPMEHVLARRTARDKGLDADTLILRAVRNKQKKGGAAYASGKTLVVLLEDGEVWFPNKSPSCYRGSWILRLYG
jgi:alkylhydroperoxidase family enzyme